MASCSRILLLSFGILLITVSVRSVAPVHHWSQRFGGIQDDQGLAVAVDASNNVIVTGRFRGTVDFGGGNLVSTGSNDIFVAKYDANGVHQWSKGFGAGQNDLGLAVAVDALGNVIVTGKFSNSVDFGGGHLVSAGFNDIFVAKYDASGVHQWSQRFGGPAFEDPWGIAVDASGSVIITGGFDDTVDFGGGNLTSTDYDIFVAKYDANGVHQWSQRFGGPFGEQAEAVAVDASGNVIVTGFIQGTVNFGGGNLTSAGFFDVFIAKYNANGAHQWSQRFGGASTDLAYAVAVDDSGAVIVTGEFMDTVDFGGGNLTSAGGEDVFVAKYDASGVHQWSQRFGGTGFDLSYGVAADASGNVMLTGAFSDTANFGGNDLVSAGGFDLFVAKYDANGAHQWSQRFGDTISDLGEAIAADASGDVIVTGRFWNTVDFGGGDLTSAGDFDIFVAKYDGSVVTGIAARDRNSPPHASLSRNFPNPFNPRTTIEYIVNAKAMVSIEIFDASGALVRRLDEGEREAGTHRAQWDGRNSLGRPVASGMYFYRLAGVRGAGARKMVLLK